VTTYENVRLKVSAPICGRQTDSLRAQDGYVLEWDGGPLVTATLNGVTNDIPMSNVAVMVRKPEPAKRGPGRPPKAPDAA
jgi:hypothetical protein